MLIVCCTFIVKEAIHALLFGVTDAEEDHAKLEQLRMEVKPEKLCDIDPP